jgi:hypothetical protein
MPRRTPSDPNDMQVSVRDDEPTTAGIQNGEALRHGDNVPEREKAGVGQYEPGQAPPEGAYRENASRPD